MANDSRVFKNENGTWLAHWSPESHGSTPPIEERIWMCQECFSKWSDFMRKLPMFLSIDWKQVALDVGPAMAERFHDFLIKRFPAIWERVKDIGELALTREIHCRSCRTCLTRATEAHVEVF